MDLVVDRLRRWVESKGTQAAAAAVIGCHESYLSRILAGERRAGLPVASRIEAATRDWSSGPILVSEWLTATDDHAPTAPQAAQVSSGGDTVDGEVAQ